MFRDDDTGRLERGAQSLGDDARLSGIARDDASKLLAAEPDLKS
jgi:hypothetical protein